MGLKRVNNKEIFNSFCVFLTSFVILLTVSFIGVFCFYKSSDLQQDNIEKDVLAYKEVLNKHYALKTKIDTVYYHMSLLSTGKVRNDVFLENYITKDIGQIKALIGEDKEENFKYYSVLISKLDSLLELKNKIIHVSDQENLALRDLNECMNRFKKVHNELTEDPSRKFNRK